MGRPKTCHGLAAVLILVSLFFVVSFSSCSSDESEDQPLFFSDKIALVKTVVIREDQSILVERIYSNSDTRIIFTLFDHEMNLVQDNLTKFTLLDKVFHPFSNIDVVVTSGDYYMGPIETHFSFNNGSTFQANYSYPQAAFGDYWLGYIPIDEDSYFLHAAANGKASKIIRIDNGKPTSDFKIVLNGYSILQGIVADGKLHVIANEVTNEQPSQSPLIHYFSSTDMGNTWGEHYAFGEQNYQNVFLLGSQDLRFRITSDNTLILYCPGKNFFFKSTDNGYWWTRTNLSITPTDIFHFSKTRAYALFENTLYETSDGGVTWTIKVKLKYPSSYLNFINESTGVVYSKDYVGYTDDGGLTWKFASAIR